MPLSSVNCPGSLRATPAMALWLTVAALAIGCQTAEKMVAPSHHRDWEPLCSVMPTAEFRGDRVMLRNVRYAKYVDTDTYVPDWYDKTIRVDAIRAVDFVVMPFPDVPLMAHTQVSFEIAEPGQPPDYVVVSAEVRKERGETYGPIKGSARQYELMYVVADERDSIQSQTNVYDRDVYLYRSTATPEQAQRLFVDIMSRVNGLAAKPEFYDTLTNNCTTNIVEHINRIQPRRVVYDYRILLPGLSDKLAYEQGLIERHGTFDQTRARAYLNPRIQGIAGRENFSQLIRR